MGKKKREKKTETAETQPKKKRREITVDTDKVRVWMLEQGDKEINSTMIRDAFSLPNRATARRIMRALAAEGKVQEIEHGDSSSKRKTFRYKVVE